MTDLVNQGKGSMLKIWNTSNEIILREIYLECKLRKVDFYNPPEKLKKRIIQAATVSEIPSEWAAKGGLDDLD